MQCDLCGSERLVVPPCADGHGVDCPDLCCADCGAAIVVAAGVFVPEPVTVTPAKVA